MPAGQLGRAFRNLHAARYHAAKGRIKNQPLPRLGQLQHLAQRVEEVTISNPALQPVGTADQIERVVAPSLTPDSYNPYLQIAWAVTVVAPSLTPDSYNLFSTAGNSRKTGILKKGQQR